jgi:hypothetical protein
MQLACISVLVVSLSGAQAVEPPESSAPEIRVSGPVVIGYFPPMDQGELDDPNSGVGEGVAHVRFALADTLRCINESGIEASGEFVMGSSISAVMHNDKKLISLPRNWPASAGIILFHPEKAPKHVPAQAGPSSLLVLGPDAALDFYGANSCEKF